MTSVAEAEGRPRSRARLLGRIALALSLTLNICFVGGLVWSKYAGRPPFDSPAQRFAQLARELDLTPDQHLAFNRFAQVAQQRGRALREHNQPLIETAWAELEKPTPDEATLSRLFEEASNNRRAYQKELGEALRAFLVTLTPQQRAHFVDLAKKRQDELAQRLWRVMAP